MIPDQAVEKFQAPDTREEALKGWLHDGAMPFWYLRASPQSRITNEAMGTFEGMPILLAVVVIPEGSRLLTTATKKNMDSRRRSTRSLCRRIELARESRVPLNRRGSARSLCKLGIVVLRLANDTGVAD